MRSSECGIAFTRKCGAGYHIPSERIQWRGGSIPWDTFPTGPWIVCCYDRCSKFTKLQTNLNRKSKTGRSQQPRRSPKTAGYRRSHHRRGPENRAEQERATSLPEPRSNQLADRLDVIDEVLRAA